MYIYYTYFDKEFADSYKMKQSSIEEGTGNPLPFHRPSECIWIVPGTVDPRED